MTATSLINLLAAASPSVAPNSSFAQFMQSGLVPMIGVGAVFFFLILRPQMRQQKEHKAKIASLKKNDMVVTAGGLIGKVIKIDDHYVELELGPNVKVKAVRSTLGDIIPPAGAAPAND